MFRLGLPPAPGRLVVAMASTAAVLACVCLADQRDVLTEEQMASHRGGNPNRSTAWATCNSIAAGLITCDGKQVGDPCTTCEVALYRKIGGGTQSLAPNMGNQFCGDLYQGACVKSGNSLVCWLDPNGDLFVNCADPPQRPGAQP